MNSSPPSAEGSAPLLSYGGIAYAWYEGAFLNRSQAQYALERLWALVAGNKHWEEGPAVTFLAITREQVDAELDLPAGMLEWFPLAEILPTGVKLGIDTDRLPALCRIPQIPAHYDGNTFFPLDLPAAVFIALTRWEEAQRPKPDDFGCHDEKSTQSYRQGFYDRPVLDEWALVIRSWAEVSCSTWRAQLPLCRFWISHDIDIPWFYRDLSRVGRGIAKGLIRQHSPLKVLENLVCGLRSLRSPEADPCYQGILSLMDLDESLDLRGTFFFMTAERGDVDEGYDLEHPSLRRLLEQARERGYDVGWHIGERASRDNEIFERECDRFFAICGETPCGVRHHYLAWRGSESWQKIADSGFSYDSSLGYNYLQGGFRCGTSHPFQVYDLQNDKIISLTERPLIIMDSAVILASKKTSLAEEAKNMKKILNRTILTGGCFSFLIHNTVEWYYQGAYEFFRHWLNENIYSNTLVHKR